jgi:hypothetical protein
MSFGGAMWFGRISKRNKSYTYLHGVAFQDIVHFIDSVVKTTYPTK